MVIGGVNNAHRWAGIITHHNKNSMRTKSIIEIIPLFCRNGEKRLANVSIQQMANLSLLVIHQSRLVPWRGSRGCAKLSS